MVLWQFSLKCRPGFEVLDLTIMCRSIGYFPASKIFWFCWASFVLPLLLLRFWKTSAVLSFPENFLQEFLKVFFLQVPFLLWRRCQIYLNLWYLWFLPDFLSRWIFRDLRNKSSTKKFIYRQISCFDLRENLFTIKILLVLFFSAGFIFKKQYFCVRLLINQKVFTIFIGDAL